ncbi:hypothetical protein EBR21_06835 [bacterium]|nr:hypothetical protein [bacterium]
MAQTDWFWFCAQLPPFFRPSTGGQSCNKRVFLSERKGFRGRRVRKFFLGSHRLSSPTLDQFKGPVIGEGEVSFF